MKLSLLELRDKIVDAYFNKGIQPHFVADINKKNVKPLIAFNLSDVLGSEDELTLTYDKYKVENIKIKKDSVIAISSYDIRKLSSSMEKIKNDNCFGFFVTVADGEKYKPCNVDGYMLDDEMLDKTNQMKEQTNKTLAERELTFTLRGKPSSEIGFDRDYYISVENPEGKRVANCIFHTVKNNYCKLGWIEIEDKDYIKIGLGSEMLKLAENRAREDGATSMTARIQPFGEFADRTMDFYRKNGFNVEYDPCDRKVYGDKKLQEMENEDDIEME